MCGTRNGNLRALLRGGGLGRRADAEVLGGLHQDISVEPEKWETLKDTSMRRALSADTRKCPETATKLPVADMKTAR